MSTIMTKEKRINTEIRRLRQIYANLPDNLKKLYDGLIRRAAYMRVQLEDYEEDMNVSGYVESFSQSANLDPYERGRPVVGFYNTMMKNYQQIMKQLAEKLPEQAVVDAGEELRRFVARSK